MIVRSILLFALAGLAEIGGGYLMWLWLREGRPLWVGVVGAFVVVLYGIIPTFQPPGLDFGKVYAAYGGAFIVLSLLWGWMVDGIRPDRPSTVGGTIALIGAAVIIYYYNAGSMERQLDLTIISGMVSFPHIVSTQREDEYHAHHYCSSYLPRASLQSGTTRCRSVGR